VRELGLTPALFGYTDTTLDPRGMDADDPRLENYEQTLPGMDHIVALGTNLSRWFDDLRTKGYDLPTRQFDIWRHQNNGDDAAGKAFSYGPPIYRAEDSDSHFLTDEISRYIDAQQGQGWFVHASYLRPRPTTVVVIPRPCRRPGARPRWTTKKPHTPTSAINSTIRLVIIGARVSTNIPPR